VRNMQKGFSFIEFILVISLIILLGTLTTSFASRFLTQSGVLNASDQLIGDLRKAQVNAMMGKQNSNWGVNFASNTITLYKGSSFATRTTAFDEKFSTSSSITISGLTDLNFYRITGTSSATPTITISGRGETRTITVNSQGVATR
jgi:type II secretory pathway pseudopilin PulG